MKSYTLALLLILTGCGTYDDALNDVPPQAADTEAGRTAYAAHNCATCHGDDGRTPALGVSRIIADIDTPRDVENALFAIQAPDSVRHAAMKSVAAQLNAQEIVDLAAYVAALP